MENSTQFILRSGEVEFKTTDECRETYNTGIFSRLLFLYCDFNNNFTIVGISLYLAWLITLFVTIGTVVDHFFCPALEFISKTLKLSQNVAGVTFLAFGNGAPEIFSSLAGAKVKRSNLVIAGLFGSAMFLTCVVSGTIMVMMMPFTMVEQAFLRDVIFLLVVAFWTYVCLWYHKITLAIALSFIGVYCSYTVYVLVAHRITKKEIKKLEAMASIDRVPTAPSMLSAIHAELTTIEHGTPTTAYLGSIVETSEGVDNRYVSNSAESITPWGAPPILRHWESGEHHISTDLLDDFDLFLKEEDECSSPHGPFTSSLNETLVASKLHEMTHVITPGTFVLFLYGICPVNYHLWPVAKWWNKLLQTLRAPIVFVLKLTIPIVSVNEHRLQNWCRPLNSLHCMATPLFLLFAFDGLLETVQGWLQLWMVFLALGATICIFSFIFTVNSVPPRFHVCWAFLGFMGSIGWLHVIAKQIVILLTTFGHIMHLSDEILGLTILSWGNGIPDFIADVTVAKAGYPQMGLSACFGGPLIIVLLGMGLSFSMVTAPAINVTHFVKISYTEMTTIFCAFLCASLLSSLCIFPLMQFKTHKFYGIYLVILYLVFIVVAMLHEFKVL